MKAKTSKIVLILSATLGLSFGSLAQAQTALKLGFTSPKDSHYGVAAAAFGEELAKRTSGRYTIELQPNSSGEKALIEGIKAGTQDMAITSTGPVGSFVPDTRIFDIPFLFSDYDQAHAVLDGPIGRDVLAKFPAKGLVALAWLENGFRHVTNNKHPITGPEDIKGLKIRTMENKVHMDAFKTLGAEPTPMAMGDVIPALQQGKIDGQENPIPVILANKLYTVQKYLTLTGHVYSPALLLISPSVWSKVSDADKKAFVEAAKVAVVANRKRVNDDEAKGISILKENGVAVTRKVDIANFKKAVAPAYEGYGKEFGEDKIKKIRDSK